MKKVSLAGDWEISKKNSNEDINVVEWKPASVPGGVHTDLLALGEIPDPFVADNEQEVFWVAESDWFYRRKFNVTSDLFNEEKVFLVCDGLDTLAEVSINGYAVGSAANMFRWYRWEVKDKIRIGENEILIHFKSPVKFVTERNQSEPLLGVSQAIPGGPHLRKAPCQFGWDWGPMLPPIGIWKEISLQGYSKGLFEDVHFRQVHLNNSVELKANYHLLNWSQAPLSAHMVVIDPNGIETFNSEVRMGDRGEVSVFIKEPELWWPNDYGEQPLYHVALEVKDGDETIDRRIVRIGLRTLVVKQQTDEFGTSFTFIVNGVPIFAKGSNWIPADSFPTRITDGSLRFLLESAAKSHQNMLRVWGGGFYEEERFYDLCDELGILVWQDMIFSCSIYPFGDESFLENVRIEIDQNVSRLRHRTSLAIWCGNNEMEWGWESWGWKQRALAYRDSYDQFFHKLLPSWLADMDPDRLYWPSSPSSNTPFENVNGQLTGDAHYWDVWHGRKPFTAYRDQYPRFMSEFGFQSLPPFETVKSYAEKEDWNMTSYVMEHHQRSGSGNGLMIGQMTDSFRIPKDFPSLVYLSMVLQAEGIRYGVEHWRRNKHRVSGTLYWQLNDCWPVASWSSLDYFGRWKALHYAAKRFYAPVLLSIEEQGSLMEVHVTNDLNHNWFGKLCWRLTRLDGEILEEGETDVDVFALVSRKVLSKLFALTDKEKRQTIFNAELYHGNSAKLENRIAVALTTFCPNKHLELVKPSVHSSISQVGGDYKITIQSDTLARFVELKLEGLDTIFEDNYFDLPAGLVKEIKFSGSEDLSLALVKGKIRIRSLYDSFA